LVPALASVLKVLVVGNRVLNATEFGTYSCNRALNTTEVHLGVCTAHFVEFYYISATNAQYILISLS
jgi:hypothetical protein